MTDKLTHDLREERRRFLNSVIPASEKPMTNREFSEMFGVDPKQMGWLARKHPTFPARKVGRQWIIRRSELRRWVYEDEAGIRWRRHRVRMGIWRDI